MKVRVTRKSISMLVDGAEIVYGVGDEFDASAELLMKFRDRLERAEAPVAEAPVAEAPEAKAPKAPKRTK